MNISKTSFSRALEITYGDVDWKNPPQELPLSSEEMLEFFFEKVLSLGVFDFIIVPRSIGLMEGFKKEGNLQICIDEAFFMREKKFFVREAMKGGVVVAVNSGSEELIDLYRSGGWVIANASFREVAGNICEYWDEKTLGLISGFGRKIFFFNHDADPVYFLNSA